MWEMDKWSVSTLEYKNAIISIVFSLHLCLITGNGKTEEEREIPAITERHLNVKIVKSDQWQHLVNAWAYSTVRLLGNDWHFSPIHAISYEKCLLRSVKKHLFCLSAYDETPVPQCNTQLEFPKV